MKMTTSFESIASIQSKEMINSLTQSSHPALSRLSTLVQERNAVVDTVNYSRMHHRHNRSPKK